MLNYYSCIFILIVFIKESSEFCPPTCTCLDFYVKCQTLDVVPIQLNPKIKYLNLTKNNITDINYSFIFYNKLQVLDLSYNQIKDIGKGNFEPVATLLVIVLNNNNIETIKNKAFAGLSELSELNLSKNKINVLNQSSFFNLENLKWLDLSFNQLYEIECSYFRYTKKLEWLSLHNNRIVRFSFQNTLSIKHLDLSMNLLQNLSASDFNSLHSLLWLNLSNNGISYGLNKINTLTNLRILDASNNFIQAVPTFELYGFNKMTHLSLNGNNIQEIPAFAFASLIALRELYLNNMTSLHNISEYAFSENKELQKIEMNKNIRFYNFPLKLFQNNLKLIDISMKENNFTTVDQHKFPLNQLKRLKLGNNPLECNCALKWLWLLLLNSKHKTTFNDYGDYYKVSIVFDSENIFCQKHINGELHRIKLIEIDKLELICSPQINIYLFATGIVISLTAILFGIFKFKKQKLSKANLHLEVQNNVDKRFEIEQFLCEKSATGIKHTWEGVDDNMQKKRRSEEMEYFILYKKNNNFGAVFV